MIHRKHVALAPHMEHIQSATVVTFQYVPECSLFTRCTCVLFPYFCVRHKSMCCITINIRLWDLCLLSSSVQKHECSMCNERCSSSVRQESENWNIDQGAVFYTCISVRQGLYVNMPFLCLQVGKCCSLVLLLFSREMIWSAAICILYFYLTLIALVRMSK